MGLFSGGFLGSGSDESRTNTTTTVNTTTTTNLRDVGLTGEASVALANVISGNIGNTLTGISEVQKSEQVESTKRLAGAADLYGGAFKESSGLFKDLLEAGTLNNYRNVEFTKSTIGDLTSAAEQQAQTVITQAKDVSQPVVSLLEGFQKNLVVLAVVLGGVLLLRKGL